MNNYFPFLLSAVICLGYIACTGTEAQPTPVEPPAPSADPADYLQANVAAARNLLAAFPGNNEIKLPFDDPDRIAWNNLPINEYPRRGVALMDMSDEQKQAVQALLRAGLSDAGYLKVNWLLWNDQRRQEDRKKAGNPTWEYYGHNHFWVTVFGEPSPSTPWGWQFEGHHLSVNLTFKNGQVATTPLFLGVDPAIVPDGPFAGLQVMKVETNAAWELLQSMDEQQRARTIIADKPFADILTREGDEAHTAQWEGIPLRDLRGPQRQLVMDIVKEYAATFPPAAASPYLDRVRQAEDEFYFAWAGGITPGEAIYYRIHGPDFIIEFDNRSGEPNHIHSVWYDLKNVFGKAW